MNWSKIWEYLKNLPIVVKEEFGAIALWVGLVAPVMSLVTGHLGNPHYHYLAVIYYLAVGLLATISRINKLKESQRRRIEILWGNGHPYVHYGEFLNIGPIQKLWRIGVYNESPVNSVCDVEVKLITMEPQVNVVIPAILHRMGDHTIKFLESYQTKTDVHPGNPQYFDVIGKLQSDELFIFYADKLLPFKLPIRDGTDQYKFTILVSGRDIPARARNFKTYIDSNQQFIMEPEGESYEPKF
jgi:hypothetical protein